MDGVRYQTVVIDDEYNGGENHENERSGRSNGGDMTEVIGGDTAGVNGGDTTGVNGGGGDMAGVNGGVYGRSERSERLTMRTLALLGRFLKL
ncbi:unnamed protein product [Cochlearia groenlandica]